MALFNACFKLHQPCHTDSARDKPNWLRALSDGCSFCAIGDALNFSAYCSFIFKVCYLEPLFFFYPIETPKIYRSLGIQ